MNPTKHAHLFPGKQGEIMITHSKKLLHLFFAKLFIPLQLCHPYLGNVAKNINSLSHILYVLLTTLATHFPCCEDMEIFPRNDRKSISTLCRDQPFSIYRRFSYFHVLSSPVFHLLMLPPVSQLLSAPPPSNMGRGSELGTKFCVRRLFYK